MKFSRLIRLSRLAGLVLVIAAVVARAQTYSVVYNFGSNSGDPNQPFYSGTIAQGQDGDLYSAANGGANGLGTVFKVSSAGTLSTLYSFTGGYDGGFPYGGLTLASDGNFYGTTFAGGSASYGTIFKITPTGSLSTLHSFKDGKDGAFPMAPPIQAVDGNLYGTTCQACGGTDRPDSGTSYGTIYKIETCGQFTPLYQFDIVHGQSPTAPLVQGVDGRFYGTTEYGGANGYGVIFKITPTGKFTVLYNFDITHGAVAAGPLVQGNDGNFYGTTLSGGTTGYGVVYTITPGGKLTVLHNMDGNTDGGIPYGGLVQATDGNFYGANSTGGEFGLGTLFAITPQGGFSVLYNFDGTTGSTPFATPFQHTSGVVYGDTNLGGTGNVSPCVAGFCGVFYSWSASLPSFVNLVPYAAKVGKKIGFLGQGFTGTTGVSFNGTAASFNVISDTYLTATVPGGASTGFVTVTTPGGTLTSNREFRVIP